MKPSHVLIEAGLVWDLLPILKRPTKSPLATGVFSSTSVLPSICQLRLKRHPNLSVQDLESVGSFRCVRQAQAHPRTRTLLRSSRKLNRYSNYLRPLEPNCPCITPRSPVFFSRDTRATARIRNSLHSARVGEVERRSHSSSRVAEHSSSIASPPVRARAGLASGPQDSGQPELGH